MMVRRWAMIIVDPEGESDGEIRRDVADDEGRSPESKG